MDFSNYYDQFGMEDTVPPDGAFDNGAQPAKANSLYDKLKKMRGKTIAPQDDQGGAKTSDRDTAVYSGLGKAAGNVASLLPALAFLKRGALIKKPTIAMMGEAGPEAVIPLGKPVEDQDKQLKRYQSLARKSLPGGMPESSDTIKLQIGQLSDEARRAVLIADGAEIPALPNGMKQARIKEGVVFYNPKQITPGEIHQASKLDNLVDILGDADDGYGTDSMDDLEPPVSVVSVRSRGGIPVQDVATDKFRMPSTLKASFKVKPQAGAVVVQAPHEALRARLKSRSMPKLADGGYGDDDNSYEAMMGEAGPEADIPISGNDQDDLDLLKKYRRMAQDDPDRTKRMGQMRSEIDARRPNYVPDAPKWWQRVLAGAAGGAAGYVNSKVGTSGGLKRAIDPSAAEHNILYPNLARKKAEYEGETERMTGAYNRERQSDQDDLGALSKMATIQNLRNLTEDRIGKRRQAVQSERRSFSDKGGRFVRPLTTQNQEVPQVQLSGAMQDKTYDTKLTPQEETDFQVWKQKYAPNDSGEDYDLRGAFKAGLTPDPGTGHWPDTFKKPNHPTFSNESQYAGDAPEKAGSWDGDNYAPSVNPPNPSAPPPVMITGGKMKMSGFTPNPEGYVDDVSAPTDPKDTKRIRPTPEYLAALKKKDDQAGWMTVATELAQSVPDAGVKAGEKIPKEAWDTLVRAATAKQKDPSMHFDASDDDNGNRTITGYDQTGKRLFQDVLVGVAKKRPERPLNQTQVSLNSPQDPAAVDYWTKMVSKDYRNMNMLNKDPGMAKAVRDRLAGEGMNINQMDAQTRDMAKLAEQGLGHVSTISTLIDKLDKEGKLGVILSRWGEFMTGKVGTGDRDFAKLRDNILLLDTNLGRVHGGARGGGSPTMLAHMKSMLNAGTMDAGILRSGMDTFKDWLGSYAGMDDARKLDDSSSGKPDKRWNPKTNRFE